MLTAPLTAHLQPQVQTVDVDKDAQFQCIISGHPVHEINWLHDGKPIIRDNRIEVGYLFENSINSRLNLYTLSTESAVSQQTIKYKM